MLLAILAALLGLFGTGPLSRVTITDPHHRFRLQYERFGRHLSPTALRIQATSAAGTDQVGIWVDLSYLKGVEIHRITPEPVRTEAAPDRLTFLFPISQPEQPISVSLHLRHTDFGFHEGQIGTADHPGLRCSQFVYP